MSIHTDFPIGVSIRSTLDDLNPRNTVRPPFKYSARAFIEDGNDKAFMPFEFFRISSKTNILLCFEI